LSLRINQVISGILHILESEIVAIWTSDIHASGPDLGIFYGICHGITVHCREMCGPLMLLPSLGGSRLGLLTLNTKIERVVCHVLALFEVFSKPGTHFPKEKLRDGIDAELSKLIKSKCCSMISTC
jgi:hypothetical protein